MTVDRREKMSDSPNEKSGPGTWYWWNGQAWVVAVPPADAWQFDPRLWRWVAQKVPAPRWMVMCGAVWLAAVLAWVIQGIGTGSEGGNMGAVFWLCVSIIAVTLAWSSVLGWHGRWRRIALVVGILAVSTLLLYDSALTNDPGNAVDADDAAAVGLVVVGLPFCVALALLNFGAAALARLARRVLGRRPGRDGAAR